MRVGTDSRHAEFKTHPGRWPTLRGENPPQGVRYRAYEVWLWPSSLTFHLRVYRWRRP